MKKQATRTEIQITGTLKQSFKKVEKKYYKSIRIPTGDDFFIQTSIWVPYTPGYSKLPKVKRVLYRSEMSNRAHIMIVLYVNLRSICLIFSSQYIIVATAPTVNNGKTLYRYLLDAQKINLA